MLRLTLHSVFCRTVHKSMILRRPDCAATKTFQSVQRPLKLGVQAAEHVCKLDFRESGSRRFYGRIHRGEGRLRFLLYGYHQSFAILSVHEGNVLRWNYIQNELTNVTKEAGLPRLTMHALRHPYVKPTTKKFLSFFKFEMAISLRAFLCFALLLSIKEGPQFVPFIW